MNKDACENVARLAVILGRLDPKRLSSAVAMNAAELAKIGRQLRTIAEMQCNGLPENEGVRVDAKTHKLIVRAREIVAPYGLKHSEVWFQGDPRGYALRFKFSGGESNNWGGDFGI